MDGIKDLETTILQMKLFNRDPCFYLSMEF